LLHRLKRFSHYLLNASELEFGKGNLSQVIVEFKGQAMTLLYSYFLPNILIVHPLPLTSCIVKADDTITTRNIRTSTEGIGIGRIPNYCRRANRGKVCGSTTEQ
jgi:hypothetical protein